MAEETRYLHGEYPDYRIASIFEAHKSDVKQVCATSQDSLLSCSRDDTIKLWGNNLYNPQNTNQLALFCPSPPMQINSVDFVEYKGTQFIFGGRKDGSIVVYEGNDSKPFIILKGHAQNVCCLHVNKEYSFLVSGGWDHNAIIWSLDAIVSGRDSDYLTLVGHQHSVWAIDSFKDLPDSVLTGSADRTVKQWQGNQLLKTFEVHKDVVRSVICLEGGNFLTGCNDGKIRCYNRDNENCLTLLPTQTEEYIYSMAVVTFDDRKFLLTSMEGGTVELYSVVKEKYYKLTYKTSLQVPTASAWSITSMKNNDIVVGGSDGFIYVFTWNEERLAHNQISEVFDARMSHFFAERNEIQKRMKEQEEQAVTVIKVTLDDSGTVLRLRYHKGTDPNIAAENFIRENNLPMSYLNEIVQYIIVNVPAAAKYGQEKRVNDIPQAFSNVDMLRPRGQLVPIPNLVIFHDLPPAIAVEKLATFNAAQESSTKLSDEQLAALESVMKNPQTTITSTHVQAFERGLSWGIDELAPIMHTLCVGLTNEALNVEMCDRHGTQVFERLINLLVSEPKVNIAIFILRCFANMAHHKAGELLLQKDVSLICDLALKHVQNNNPKLQVAASSVLVNISLILWRNTEINKVAELGPREDAVRSIIKAFESDFIFDICEQALIFILQAVATVMWGDASVIVLAKNRNLLKFINTIKDKVADEGGKELARDIVGMLQYV